MFDPGGEEVGRWSWNNSFQSVLSQNSFYADLCLARALSPPALRLWASCLPPPGAPSCCAVLHSQPHSPPRLGEHRGVLGSCSMYRRPKPAVGVTAGPSCPWSVPRSQRPMLCASPVSESRVLEFCPIFEFHESSTGRVPLSTLWLGWPLVSSWFL